LLGDVQLRFVEQGQAVLGVANRLVNELNGLRFFVLKRFSQERAQRKTSDSGQY